MQDAALWFMVLGVSIGSFVFVGWIVWLGVRQQRSRQENEIELRARMLDKFGTSEEFVGFMQTDAGREFLETSGVKTGKSMRQKAVSSLSTGVILILLGAAFFFINDRMGGGGMLFPAAILTAIGIGLGISGFIYSRFSGENGKSS